MYILAQLVEGFGETVTKQIEPRGLGPSWCSLHGFEFKVGSSEPRSGLRSTVFGPKPCILHYFWPKLDRPGCFVMVSPEPSASWLPDIRKTGLPLPLFCEPILAREPWSFGFANALRLC